MDLTKVKNASQNSTVMGSEPRRAGEPFVDSGDIRVTDEATLGVTAPGLLVGHVRHNVVWGGSPSG